MTDIRSTIEPKSDQLNFDDMIGGQTLTIKITKVSVASGEQPVSINYENDNGKPYKPCKSMRRVFVYILGTETKNWIGRRVTLYGDASVKFGGEQVGGIRISHMSGINEPVTLALTASRATRKSYTVKPLADETRKSVIEASTEARDAAALVNQGHAAAERGMGFLQAFWANLTQEEKRAVGGAPQLDSWKRTAADVDASNA